jgi:hypothetical protein
MLSRTFIPRPVAMQRFLPLLLPLLAASFLAGPGPAPSHAFQLLAASDLLESVKQNKSLAMAMCNQFRQLNAQGQSATSKDSISQVAQARGLSMADAEVLTVYVIGLHCPEVR